MYIFKYGQLYGLLTLIDAIRVDKVRESQKAIELLKVKIKKWSHCYISYLTTVSITYLYDFNNSPKLMQLN